MLYENGESKVDDIAEVLGISRVTCYRYIDIAKKERKQTPAGKESLFGKRCDKGK